MTQPLEVSTEFVPHAKPLNFTSKSSFVEFREVLAAMKGPFALVRNCPPPTMTYAL